MQTLGVACGTFRSDHAKGRRSAQTRRADRRAGNRSAVEISPRWGSHHPFALAHDALEREVRVQDHQVGVLARLQRADPVVQAEQPAGLAEMAATTSSTGSRSTVTARRKARSRVSVEPAIEPPSTSRATPSLTSTASGPSW